MKTIFDYMIEHSGGSSIDYNAMINDINKLEAENSKLQESLKEKTEDFLERMIKQSESNFGV